MGSGFAIERGGCNRVLVDADGSLRQLDPAVVSRLVG
jgi:hypothetical protein